MQRYFIATEQIQEQKVILDGEDAHHLFRVMRAKPGDQIIVSDGIEREALAELTQLDKDRAEAEVIEWLQMDQEPLVQVTIAQSMPKGDKFETVLQKGTELGAVRFIPFVSERTVVQYDSRKEAKRLERWRKISKEAAEQAHRNRVPVIEAPVDWKHILQLSERFDLAMLCYEQVGGSAGLRPLLQQFQVASADKGELSHSETNREHRPTVLLIVGPEGGFTEREANEAEQAGIQLVGLGRRILRTETAAMVGLSCIMYEFNEMGGTL